MQCLMRNKAQAAPARLRPQSASASSYPPICSPTPPPAVQLMLGVQDEEDVQGARQAWVGPVPGVAPRIQHVQEVLAGGRENG